MPPRKVPIHQFLEQGRRDWIKGTAGLISAHAQVGINVIPEMIATLEKSADDLKLRTKRTLWERLKVWAKGRKLRRAAAEAAKVEQRVEQP